MAKRRGRPKLGKTGCLFWLFIFLVIIVIILYRGKGSFRETFSIFRDKITTGEEEEEEVQLRVEDREVGQPFPEGESPEEQGSQIDRTPEADLQVREKGRDTTLNDIPETERISEEKTIKPALPPSTGEQETVESKNLRTPLYYIMINTDGSAQLQPVIRTVDFTDSPITRTIESLLSGPTPREQEKGLISFIPEGTTLLSARIQGGHLTLNFSDSFEKNYNGREAIHFQLSQIMLTSFEFRQVTALTILIGGQRKRYITGEGIPLKEVYTKDDLSLLSTHS